MYPMQIFIVGSIYYYSFCLTISSMQVCYMKWVVIFYRHSYEALTFLLLTWKAILFHCAYRILIKKKLNCMKTCRNLFVFEDAVICQ